MKKAITLLMFLISFCFQYAKAEINCECQNLYKISVNTKDGVRFGYINCLGKIVVEPTLLTASPFADGVGVVNIERKNIGQKEDGRPIFEITDGIIDVQGALITVPKANIFSAFSEGLALSKINGKLAYIDKLGHVEISIPDDIKISDEDYSSPEEFPFTNGIAALRAEDGGFYLIDKSGKITFCEKLNAYYDENGLTIVEEENKYALIDKMGNYILNPQNEVIDTSEDIYYTVPDGKNVKYKFFNNKGKKLFELFADYVGPFSDGLAKVQINGKWGFINKSGKLVITTRFSNAEDFSEDFAAVKERDKWGFINKKGEFVILPAFDYINQSFECGLAYVQNSRSSGYINKKGMWVWTNSGN